MAAVYFNGLSGAVYCILLICQKNRIYRRSPMQTEKSQPDGKRIKPETMFTDFPAKSVHPRAGISRSASETNI